MENPPPHSPLPLPAAAQPWASEGARLAGRQALAAAQQNRFLEAESVALAADPLARKLVAWWRIQARGSGASARDVLAWLEENVRITGAGLEKLAAPAPGER